MYQPITGGFTRIKMLCRSPYRRLNNPRGSTEHRCKLHLFQSRSRFLRSLRLKANAKPSLRWLPAGLEQRGGRGGQPRSACFSRATRRSLRWSAARRWPSLRSADTWRDARYRGGLWSVCGLMPAPHQAFSSRLPTSSASIGFYPTPISRMLSLSETKSYSDSPTYSSTS